MSNIIAEHEATRQTGNLEIHGLAIHRRMFVPTGRKTKSGKDEKMPVYHRQIVVRWTKIEDGKREDLGAVKYYVYRRDGLQRVSVKDLDPNYGIIRDYWTGEPIGKSCQGNTRWTMGELRKRMQRLFPGESEKFIATVD